MTTNFTQTETIKADSYDKVFCLKKKTFFTNLNLKTCGK